MTLSLEDQLAHGVSALALALPRQAPEQLLRYLALLQKWNRTYNLTAIREARQLVTHHLLDCLAVVPHIPSGRLVDVGSGAGLPGVPIALARPDQSIALLESSHKKGAFLKQVVIECGLANVEVHVGRAEDWSPDPRFDLAISRAFSDLAGFADAARTLIEPGGTLVAMKGVHPDEELASLPASVVVDRVLPLQVPGLKAARHLVFLRVQS
jgi:16S rRNA (guanine527-N7)-methyltransferase